MNYEDNWYVRKIDHDLLQYIVLVVSISNSPKFSTQIFGAPTPLLKIFGSIQI